MLNSRTQHIQSRWWWTGGNSIAAVRESNQNEVKCIGSEIQIIGWHFNRISDADGWAIKVLFSEEVERQW